MGAPISVSAYITTKKIDVPTTLHLPPNTISQMWSRNHTAYKKINQRFIHRLLDSTQSCQVDTR